MNKRIYSRRVLPTTVVPVLSILGSTTSAIATSNGVNAARAYAQLRADVTSHKFRNRSHGYAKTENDRSSATTKRSEGEFSTEGEGEERRLETENGDHDEGTRMPRQSPIVIDIKKRDHSKPPSDSMAALLITSEWSPEQPIVRSKYNPLIPFYPDLVTHTCHADNYYPEHYLYDISAYFSHSPQACCELHFNGLDSENCIKGVVYDSSIIQHNEGNTMNGMMKKEGYRLDDVTHFEFEGTPAGIGEGGGEEGTIPMGKKKPMNTSGGYSYESPPQSEYPTYSPTQIGVPTGVNGEWSGNQYPTYSPTRMGVVWGSNTGAPILSQPIYHYCGTSFVDANIKCGRPCPSGTDADCTQGESCFADAITCPAYAGTSDTPIYNYCGTSFVDANAKCGKACPSGTDADCSQGESCFADVIECPVYAGTFEVEGNANNDNGLNTDANAVEWDEGGLHLKQIRCERRILQWDYGWDEGGYGWDAKSTKSKASKMAKSKASKMAKSKAHKKSKSMDGNAYPTHSPTQAYSPIGWGGSEYPTHSPTQAYSPTGWGGSEYPTHLPAQKGGDWGGATYTYDPTCLPTYSPGLSKQSKITLSTAPTTLSTAPTAPTTPAASKNGDEYPTYSPTGTYSPTEKRILTYSPTSKGGGWGGNKYPTYSPTQKGGGWDGGWGGWGGTKIPTYSPTWKGGGWGGATYSPTKSDNTNATTSIPTKSITLLPSATPTMGETTSIPTKSITLLPSATPTMGEPTEIPTMEGTIGPPLDLLVWGSPFSTSQPEDDGNILIPLDSEIVGIDASAGTKYSLVIYPDGRAFSTGYITDPNGSYYHGHLGIRPEDLVEGQNMWLEIERVFDHDMGGVTFPPRFKKGFAGVENSEGEGDIHTILLDGKGNAWATGNNDAGQLCLGDMIDKLIPQRIPVKNIVDVAIGGQHTLLLDSDGTVYGCGSNKFGQLGLSEAVETSPNPVKVYLLQVPATSVSAGKDHSVIIAEDGNYVMGSNAYGQLCVDTQGENVYAPSAFDVEEKIVTAFEATRESSYILYVDGSVNACGRNNFGQLGDGTEDDAFLATVAMPRESKVVRLLGAGPSSYSAFFVSDDETVFGAGLNDRGQLGVGDEENRNVPTLVKLQDEVKVFVLSSADDHSLTLKEGGVERTAYPTITPTYAPVGEDTELPTPDTIEPTYDETFSPTIIATEPPSILPTIEDIPTSSPTIPQTVSPTQMGLEYFFWGAPEAVGEPVDAPDVTSPINVGSGVIYSGAGTKYTVLILKDGSALAAGYVEDIDDYQGHLGIDQNLILQGVNTFHLIGEVYDLVEAGQDNVTMAVVDAPRFEKVFLGVENTPDTGEIHTVLLDADGNAWATGNNLVGQLCLGDDIDRMIPEKIPIEGKIVDVAIGGEHTLLLLEDGSVYGCGSNAKGQLGLGEEQTVSSPTKLGDLTSAVLSVSAGHSHSLLMATDGIYLSGSNEYGQLCVDTKGENVLTPTALEIDERVAISFEAIKESTFILYDDGSVNACGRNNFGQLGDGTDEDQLIAIAQTNGTVVRLLGVGPSAQSVFFVTSEELVLGTGLNDRGQLGVGDSDDRNLPTRVKFEEMVSIDQLYVSEIHSIAVGTTIGTFLPTTAPSVSVPATSSPTRQGKNMYYWGSPDSIGEADTEDISTPFDSGNNVVDASGGSRYTVILLSDGTALSAGYIDSLENYQGHLGRGDEDVVEGVNEMMTISLVYDSVNLTIIDSPQFDKVFAGVENSPGSGTIHTILLDVQGRAWATGSNEKGQLCLGDDVTMVTIPEKIPIEGKIVDVAIGGEHTLLVDEFGNVYGCGSNVVGQLGLGATEKTSVPTNIDGLASVTSVSAGHSHSVFMSDDGIYFTGSNEFGQLCDNTNGENVLTPSTLDIPGIESATHFEAIKSSSYILYTDGSVSGCGNNEFGQLGDGTNFDRILSLVQLDGVAKFLGVGPSAESVFFVTDDELVWGTGLNDRGQLGTGDTENRNIPTLVKFEEGVILEVLSAAGDHTVAIGSSDGTLIGPSDDGTFEPTKNPSLSPTVGNTSTPTASPTLPSSIELTGSLSISPTLPPLMTDVPTAESEMYYWGSSGSLGDSPSDATLAPLKSGIRAADLSAGSKYTIIVFSDGTAQSGGLIDSLDNYHGHLGLEEVDVSAGENPFKTIMNVFDADNDLIIDAPFFVKAFAGAEDTASSGSIHTLLIDKDGQVWVTGSNNKGQLCLGDTEDRLIPQRVPIDGRVENAAVGGEHTLLLLEDGTVYGCGSNEAGQLGLGDDATLTTGDPITTPTIIEGLPVVESLSSGLSFSLFKAIDGLYVTGSNLYGQLCVDETIGESVTTPYLLADVNVAIVSSFNAIKTSSFILFNDGTIGACGRNEFGQLGDGSNIDRVRTVVEPLPNELPIKMIGVGPSAESVFFVTDDELVWGTGLNDQGQLGTGDTENRNIPTPVKFEEGVVLEVLSAAGDHTVAIGSSDGPSVSPTVENTLTPTAVENTSSPTASPTITLTIDTAGSPSQTSNSPTMPVDTSITPTIDTVSIIPTIPISPSPTIVDTSITPPVATADIAPTISVTPNPTIVEMSSTPPVATVDIAPTIPVTPNPTIDETSSTPPVATVDIAPTIPITPNPTIDETSNTSPVATVDSSPTIPDLSTPPT
ncbi:hypothetical protein ACHAW5_000988 [Stephanodiscus triporus]|uniref:RCC1-like domain-containing protein n=1 Tax=Stephanodiscus triporus TaxID=2934178 RepID=A0ABD3NAE5_9STRA